MIYLENKNKLYVGNLPYTVDANALRDMFASFGEITDAVIITDKFRGNRSKGFGFVEFADDAMAQAAVEAMNEKEVEGRKLVVNIARPQKERTDYAA